MKKLSLESLNLENADVLEKENLKTVYGGDYTDCPWPKQWVWTPFGGICV